MAGTPRGAKARRRSPQEKKRLSYLRDRRNDYGENDKNSRKNIRRNKRFHHRSQRRAEHLATTGVAVPEDAEAVERRLDTRWRQKGHWRKWPDEPLGEYLQVILRRRADGGTDDPTSFNDRISRIRRRMGLPTGILGRPDREVDE